MFSAKRRVAEPHVDTNTFPPRPSSHGKRYYVLLSRHSLVDGPGIACGSAVALSKLEGSFVGRGKAPRGFANLESAIQELLRVEPQERVQLFLK